MKGLRAIDAWPSEHAAAAIVAAGTVIAEHGELDRRFPLASVTKLLTSYATLVAVEEESLSLDDAAGPPGATVAHLLAHASGLGPDGHELTAPGRRRIYSNAGFEVLAGEVEAHTGVSFADYLVESVLEPLDMHQTRLEGSAAHEATSTVADLTRFAAELLHPTLLTRATLEAATTVAFPGLAGVLPGYGRMDPNDWGLGFELRDHKPRHWTGSNNSPLTFGHFGQSGTFLWADPGAGGTSAALVCLTDEPFGEWAVEAWPRLSDAVLAQIPRPHRLTRQS